MTVDTQFLNTKEVAEILGVHQKTVHNWLRTGKLAGTKISYRAWRIPRSALEEFVVSNSNVRPNALGKDTKNDGDSNPDSKIDAIPEAGMKHYIRDIMGEDGNERQTNNE
jgi:excisionase family DNA binding protein